MIFLFENRHTPLTLLLFYNVYFENIVAYLFLVLIENHYSVHRVYEVFNSFFLDLEYILGNYIYIIYNILSIIVICSIDD